MELFSPDYLTARARFRGTVHAAGGRLQTLDLDARGPAGDSLGIDIGWFGPEKPERVLLHSSGLHGIEGFAGSAIQLHLLENLPRIPRHTALVLVHILNPYGMAWLRRVNENNVDLNRNFVGGDGYAGAPEAYTRCNAFLNPESAPSHDWYLLKAQWLILRYGMAALKQAVAGGQYEYPKGLFFGGKRLEQGPEKYETFLVRHLASAGRIIAIDVHTGLGEYAEDTLLVEMTECERLRPVFGWRVAALEPRDGPAYSVRGAIQHMLSRVAPHARLDFMGQEFGTYPPTRVLRALREENRWHHYGDGGLHHHAKANLREVFCPQDASWRGVVLERGQDVVHQAMDLL